jgi:hypothetical protein
MLVDTGILLRLFVPADPACPLIRTSIRRLRGEGVPLRTTFQNIAEFWNVSTRPFSARGGYGLASSVVEARLRFIERLFPVVSESLGSFRVWKDLVARHGLQGVSVHDARLVAIMLCEQHVQMLTLNAADFQRYSADGVRPLTPDDILAGLR